MAKGTKTGGRAKGIPNKKTNDLIELINQEYEGFNPIIELIKLSKKKDIEDSLRASILKDVASYIYPKRKSIDATTYENESKIHFIVVGSEEEKKMLEDI